MPLIVGLSPGLALAVPGLTGIAILLSGVGTGAKLAAIWSCAESSEPGAQVRTWRR